MNDHLAAFVATLDDDDARTLWIYGGYGTAEDYPGRVPALASALDSMPIDGRRPPRWVASVVAAACRRGRTGGRVQLRRCVDGRGRTRITATVEAVQRPGDGPEPAREGHRHRNRADVVSVPHTGPPHLGTRAVRMVQVVMP